MRRLAAFAAVAVALAGCGTRHETIAPRSRTALRVALVDPNAGEAPIYAAARDGRFAAAGLAVTLRQAGSPLQSLSQLAAGGAELAVSTEPAVLEARDRGLRVVAVAAVVDAPLSSAIWLRGGPVRSPADLGAHPVGTPGLDYQRAFARQAGARDASIRDVGRDGVRALERRRVEAVVGAYPNQAVELELAGRRPVTTPVDRLGVPPFDELVLAVRTDAITRKRDVVRSFVGALMRATHDLLHGSQPALPGDPRVARIALSRTLGLLTPPPPQPYGYMDPSLWQPFSSWMRVEGLLRRPPAGAYTNALLPGEGL